MKKHPSSTNHTRISSGKSLARATQPSNSVIHPSRPCREIRRVSCDRERRAASGCPSTLDTPTDYHRQADRLGNALPAVRLLKAKTPPKRKK
jgi:hypothetical protein